MEYYGRENRMTIYLCFLLVGGKAVGYAEAARRNVAVHCGCYRTYTVWSGMRCGKYCLSHF